MLVYNVFLDYNRLYLSAFSISDVLSKISVRAHYVYSKRKYIHNVIVLSWWFLAHNQLLTVDAYNVIPWVFAIYAWCVLQLDDSMHDSFSSASVWLIYFHGCNQGFSVPTAANRAPAISRLQSRLMRSPICNHGWSMRSHGFHGDSKRGFLCKCDARW